MNTNRSIKINGLDTAFSVDVENEILVDWSGCGFSQRSYSISMMRKDKVIFEQENIVNPSKRAFIEIPPAFRSNDRTRYTVTIEITGQDGQRYIVDQVFYSENKNLKQASWITRLDNPILKEYEYFQESANTVLEKEFTITEVSEQSFIDICGLGYYSLFINGRRVHDTYLTSDVTNYDEIVYYDTIEVSPYINKGKNKIRVELGNGWYNPAPILILGRYNVRKQLAIGKPCLLAQLSVYHDDQNEVILHTDATWSAGYGQFLSNNIYIGEHYTDHEVNDVATTTSVYGPSGKLTSGSIPKVKRKKEICPKIIEQTETQLILDLEEIVSGQVAFDISEDFIGHITLYYAEDMNDKNELNYSSTISGVYGLSDSENHIHATDPIIQKDEITKTKSNALHFENTHTYHSFRYIKVQFSQADTGNLSEVRGILKNMVVYLVHTDLAQQSTFSSSNTVLNDLWDASIATRLNNIHSYFEDCARERFGYAGDIVALLDTQVQTLDVEGLLKKVFLDFAVDQTKQGGITQTAPYVGIMTHGPSNGAGSTGWQLIFPSLAIEICNRYKDVRFIKKHLLHLERHVDYLLAFDYDYIKHCCLGDWGSVDTVIEHGKICTPDQTFCSATMYYLILSRYQNLFEAIGERGSRYELLLDKMQLVQYKIVKDFYHCDGYFASGSQSSFIFAIQAQLLDADKQAALEQLLINQIEQDNGVFRFGIFGMSWIWGVLSGLGKEDLVYRWLMREESPSYRAMLNRGNKVLSEYFPLLSPNSLHANASYNHAMFSSYSSWMIRNLVGISQHLPQNHIMIQPYFPENVEFVQGSIHTEYGEVVAKWEQIQADKYKMSVTLPYGLDYTIRHHAKYHVVTEVTDLCETDRLINIVYERTL